MFQLAPRSLDCPYCPQTCIQLYKLSEALKKKFNVVVIWGGKHVTLDVEESVKHCDIAFLHESELSLREFLDIFDGTFRPESYRHIKGICIRNGKDYIRTEHRPLHEDLDHLAFPYIGLENRYVIKGDEARKADNREMQPFINSYYPTMIARGCPLKCTFCANNEMGMRKVRKRSIQNVIDELNDVRRQLPQLKAVELRDDCLLALPLDYVKDFCEEYKKQVNLPLYSSGVVATAVNEKKLGLFIDAGLKWIKMGIQSGSQEVRKEVFKRPESDKHILNAMKIFRDFNLEISYLLIVDNPWETEQHRVEGLRLMSRLKGPRTINMFSLMLYPGTELYKRGLAEKRSEELGKYLERDFQILDPTYFNQLTFMLGKIERFKHLIKFMTKKNIYRNAVYQKLFQVAFKMIFPTYNPHHFDRNKINRITKKDLLKIPLRFPELASVFHKSGQCNKIL